MNGPKPTWLFGNLLAIKVLPINLTTWVKTFGPIYKIFMGGRRVIVVTDPEFAHKVVMKSNMRPYNELSPPSSGLRKKFEQEIIFWAHGKMFKTLKSGWQVAFNEGSIENYFPLMSQHVDQFCQGVLKLKAENKGEVFDIHQSIQKMALDIVGTTAFGIQFGFIAENQQQFQKVYGVDTSKFLYQLKVTTSGFFASSETLWGIFNFIFPELRKIWERLSSLKLFVGKTQDSINNAFVEVALASKTIAVNERIKFNQTPQNAENVKNIINPGSFLAKLVKTKDPTNDGQLLTDQQVGSQAMTFIIAGFDTTAATISFTIYLLCQNPFKKQKLFEELETFKDSELTTGEVLQQCKYLEAVIQESLRLYPPGAYIMRKLESSCQLSTYTIPKNSIVIINIYGIQRNPEIWRKPEEFLPERFLEGQPEYEIDKIHPFAYIPFGGGSRMCIGRRFALQEAKIALFKIFQRYDFVLEPGQENLETKMELILSPKNGLFVRAIERI